MAATASSQGPCCVGQDWCAVTCTSRILARKWNTIIVKRLLAGPRRFVELRKSVSGLSDRVLSDTLADLQDLGVVRPIPDGEESKRYALTGPGRDLAPVVSALETWGRRYLLAPAAGGIDRASFRDPARRTLAAWTEAPVSAPTRASA